MSKDFNHLEFESIYLKAIIDSLDSMLNSRLLELRGNDPETEVYFHEETHQKYFYVLLVDFLSRSKIFTGEKVTCLAFIKRVCESPNFDIDNSVSKLKTVVEVFGSWLNEEITIESYFPSIDKECNLKIKREDFIRICANISKHNFMRLNYVAESMSKILKRNNIKVNFAQSLVVLDDFYERFHNDILIYHTSNIVEMLNNIRWGIHEYLSPEFTRAYKKDTADKMRLRYSYNYPKNLTDEFAKTCYWGLMNSVRAKPHIKKFEALKWLKLRY